MSYAISKNIHKNIFSLTSTEYAEYSGWAGKNNIFIKRKECTAIGHKLGIDFKFSLFFFFLFFFFFCLGWAIRRFVVC